MQNTSTISQCTSNNTYPTIGSTDFSVPPPLVDDGSVHNQQHFDISKPPPSLYCSSYNPTSTYIPPPVYDLSVPPPSLSSSSNFNSSSYSSKNEMNYCDSHYHNSKITDSMTSTFRIRSYSPEAPKHRTQSSDYSMR